MPYAEQLLRKRAALEAALGDEPELARLPIGPVVPSARPFGYRHQAKLVLRARRRPRRGGREVLLGIYRPRTHSVAPADRCPVHHPRLRRLLADVRKEVEDLGIPIYDERRREGALRYVVARTSSWLGESQLTLVSAIDRPPGLRPLLERLRRAHPDLRSVVLCVNPTHGNAILSDDLRPLFGPLRLGERFAGLVLEASPEAFLQAHPAMAGRIYATAARWLRPAAGDVVLDLCCGVGAVSLTLAPRVSQVLGVDAVPGAIACARRNALRLGLRRARFVLGDAADAERIVREARLPPDLVVANPPRRGLGAAAIAALGRLRPRAIAYLSCDPRSLARDLAALVRQGFAVQRVRGFDMLPQTPHVEALALLGLTRGSRPLPCAADSR